MAKKTKEEIKKLIDIGFCQPKFYIPSIWAKAKRIMETLCDETSYVERFDYGRGKGKYRITWKLDGMNSAFLADAYMKIKGW